MLTFGDENQSGKLAKSVTASQLAVVRMKVSLRLSWKFGFRKARVRLTPTKRVAPADVMKTCQTSPFAVRSATAGKVIDRASTIRSRPITNSEDRRSITGLSAALLPAHGSTKIHCGEDGEEYAHHKSRFVGLPIIFRNSRRVLASDLKSPVIRLVTMLTPDL